MHSVSYTLANYGLIQAVTALVLNSPFRCGTALPAAPLERHQLCKCWQPEKAAESFLMKIRKRFLLSLHHQNNNSAGTDSIGLSHLEMYCYSTCCQKVTGRWQIKGGTNFTFDIFISHNRSPPQRMSGLDLQCLKIPQEYLKWKNDQKVTDKVISAQQTNKH